MLYHTTIKHNLLHGPVHVAGHADVARLAVRAENRVDGGLLLFTLLG